jgi:hypothetical protein
VSHAEPDRAILDAVLADVRPPRPDGPGATDTVALLVELARAWPEDPDARGAAGLDALMRKLSAAREIFAAYGPGWSRPERPEPLGPAAWALLAAVLIAYARSDDRGDPEARGVALKRVNGALTALDIGAARGGIPRHGALEAWARERLGALVEA